jgi:hypothetical protein
LGWRLKLYLLSLERDRSGGCIRIHEPFVGSGIRKDFSAHEEEESCHVPHGPYQVSATSQQRQGELRERLSGGGDCLLVGFFGDIRPYKNSEVLAYLPDQDAIGREIKIVVAGAADPTYNTTEIEVPLSRILPKRMVRIKERISDQDLADMIRAVDFVLLPYLRGSNSGFSMPVLSCGQRLLCSALPMFRELQNRHGPHGSTSSITTQRTLRLNWRLHSPEFSATYWIRTQRHAWRHSSMNAALIMARRSCVNFINYLWFEHF